MTYTMPPDIANIVNRVGQLTYAPLLLPNTQRRLAGRVALVPEIDLSRYRCQAVIDFIELRFTINRRSQFQHVKRIVDGVLGRSCFVIELDGDGGSASTFMVRVTDAQVAELVDLEQAIDRKFGIVGGATIDALEISVDFYARNADIGERLKMLKVVTSCFVPSRNILDNPLDRPRFINNGTTPQFLVYGGRDMDEGLVRQFRIDAQHDLAPPADATLYVGAKGSESAWRIMHKTLDRQNTFVGTRTDLAEADRRIRIEVTLRGGELQALGLAAIDDLRRFRFARLQAAYFNFMLPTFRGSASTLHERCEAWRDTMRAEKFMKTGILGLMAMDEALADQYADIRKASMGDMRRRGLAVPRKKRVAGGRARTMVAHKSMNRLVSHALENLGRRVAVSFSHRDMG